MRMHGGRLGSLDGLSPAQRAPTESHTVADAFAPSKAQLQQQL